MYMQHQYSFIDQYQYIDESLRDRARSLILTGLVGTSVLGGAKITDFRALNNAEKEKERQEEVLNMHKKTDIQNNKRGSGGTPWTYFTTKNNYYNINPLYKNK